MEEPTDRQPTLIDRLLDARLINSQAKRKEEKASNLSKQAPELWAMDWGKFTFSKHTHTPIHHYRPMDTKTNRKENRTTALPLLGPRTVERFRQGPKKESALWPHLPVTFVHE